MKPATRVVAAVGLLLVYTFLNCLLKLLSSKNRMRFHHFKASIGRVESIQGIKFSNVALDIPPLFTPQ